MRSISEEVEIFKRGQLNVSEAPLDQIIAESDIVSLHVPLWSATKNLIGRSELSKMKSGSFLINTARGGIVDEEALYQSLQIGHMGGAALDVFSTEPYHGALIDCDNVVLTPHSGSCSLMARKMMEIEAAEEVVRFLKGDPLTQEVPDEEYRYSL